MIFDEELILQEKSEMENKAQGGAPDSSTDTQEKGVQFSENSKRPDGSKNNSSNSDEEQKATQEQPRPLRRPV